MRSSVSTETGGRPRDPFGYLVLMGLSITAQGKAESISPRNILNSIFAETPKIGYDYDIDIVELEIPVDHIHMVVRSEPKISPSNVMQIVKSISARQFFKLRPEIKKKYFWGGKLWTQSYFVESIGNANEEVIRAYVQDQLKVMNEHEDEARQRGLF